MVQKQQVIIFLVVLGIILVSYYLLSNNIIQLPGNSIENSNSSLSNSTAQNQSPLLKCTDGTNVNSCSFSKQSYFCTPNRELVFNCESCGCAYDSVCSNSACIISDSFLLSKIDQSLVYIKTSYSNGSGVIVGHVNGQTIVVTSKQVVRYASNLSDVHVTFVNSAFNITANPNKITVDQNGSLATLYLFGLIGTPASSSLPTLGQDVLAVGSPIAGKNRVSSGTVSNIDHSGVQTSAPVNSQNQGGGIFTRQNGSLVGIAIIDPSFEGQGPIASLVINSTSNSSNSGSNQTTWVPEEPACDCRVCDCH